MNESSPQPLLSARGIHKSFPGVRALDDVSLELGRGEVLCLVGENGAGKSTLMKILGGVYTADLGTIRFDGREVELDSVQRAQQLGITLIHQELNLAHTIDVAGNIFLGREPRWGGPLRLIDRVIYRQSAQMLERLGLDVSPRRTVSDLSIGQQQLVEIARALCFKSRVLIMDEPTSSLTQRETDRLFEVIAELKRDGVSVVYISHRLAEVRQIADRATVLRDGKNAGELARDEITHDALVRLMVGRDLKQFFHVDQRRHTGDAADLPALLELDQVVPLPSGRPVSVKLRGGEVVGMAGLMGAGRTELAEAIFGIRPRTGQVLVGGTRLPAGSPRSAIAAGVLLVPEDRRLHGLILAQTVRENISLPSLKRIDRAGLIRFGAERELATRMSRRLGVRGAGIEQLAGLLSGGNQQKVVLARWLARDPKVLILDEPTRGIDVGAKEEIYVLMRALAAEGVAVLMISSDLEEILGVSDRVLVMHEGCLAGELSADMLSEESVMQLATGGRPASAQQGGAGGAAGSDAAQPLVGPS